MPNATITVSEVLRSHVDSVQVDGGRLRVSGWVCHPSLPIESFAIGLDGQPWVEGIGPRDRPDVQACYPAFRHATRVGFNVVAPLAAPIPDPKTTTVTITPFSGGRALDTVRAYYCAYADERLTRPQPPVALQQRIGGSDRYVEIATQATTLVRTYVEKYKPLASAQRVLDWGCGCGRLIGQLMKFVPAERLYGCDIDAEAIAWDRENLPGPSFTACAPYPPTPYPDRHFDVVYAISVLTHLDEETQFAWLAEMQRITRPGSILLLSVIGSELREKDMPPELRAEYAKKGFAVTVPAYSKLLEAFSHENYYKEAFHSLDYIAGTWSRYFDVLEYVETRHQDLVLLRAR